jgi:hypothetical protein
MRSILPCLAALTASWAGPAGATLICPDATGTYSPMNCDWIWPFEHPPGARECSFEDEFLWKKTGQGAIPYASPIGSARQRQRRGSGPF